MSDLQDDERLSVKRWLQVLRTKALTPEQQEILITLVEETSTHRRRPASFKEAMHVVSQWSEHQQLNFVGGLHEEGVL